MAKEILVTPKKLLGQGAIGILAIFGHMGGLNAAQIAHFCHLKWCKWLKMLIKVIYWHENSNNPKNLLGQGS